MPNLRSKTWTTTTLANVEDAQYWEDHLISAEDAAKAAGAVQDAFKTIEVQSGGSTTNVVANKEDAITLEAGTNITLTAIGKNIRINSTGGGGGGGSYTASKGIIISDSDIEADLKDYDLSSEEATAFGSTANRTYAVGLDSNGDLAVNIPWTDINFPANAKLGAHNRCPYPYKSGTSLVSRDITFTADSNGIINANGTNDNTNPSNYILFGSWASTAAILPSGAYNISTKTSNSDVSIVVIYNETTLATIVGDGVVNAPNGISYAYVSVAKNKSVSNEKIKPLITVIEDTDPTFAPHTMTNRELTPQVLYNQNNIYICKQGKIVVAQFNGAKPSNIASLNFASLGAKPVMVTSTFQCRCDAKPTSVELNANGTVANVGYYASYGATYTDLKSDTSKNVYGSICFVSE